MNKQRGFGMYGYLIIAVVGFALVAGIGTAVWKHFDNIANLERTVREQASAIATHKANEAQYLATIENKERQIDNMREAADTVEEHRKEVDKKFAAAREQAQYVKRIFADHDFEKLAKAKPGLISKRMQRGTDNAFQEFEDTANAF